ncbi:energy-coupling factor transporter transmembrane component T [Lacticaseibacillus nasuensis]|uniref:energy-coupling factor transporter transmembrane component T n=1 Tax=Lacticaseibacillus nasuensis TaxID=944671 RepID=UPI002246E9D5|nr:energy-coupling factor transporter transmembrane component T [Lacticaseibacillus nasuensis]MCX2456023.1 energy-coupling factor transporter transmembrane protein EcfT [Lacticaseibacillus nasuensis]
MDDATFKHNSEPSGMEYSSTVKTIEDRYNAEKVYPTTKLMFAVVLSLATFLLPLVGAGYYITVINIILAGLAHKFRSYVSLGVKTLMPIALLMFLFQLFITSGVHVLFSVGPLAATQEGLTSAITFSSNICGIASSIMLFFQLTHVRSITKAMEHANLPKNFIFVVNSTLLFVPESSKLSKVIMEAQQSRGVEMSGSISQRIKSFIPMISPLVLSTISNNEEKVLTLESRGYSFHANRTVLFPIEKTNRDRILFYLCVCVLVTLIVGRIFVW